MSTRQLTGRVVWIAAAAGIAVATLSPSSERVSGTVSVCVICGDMGGVDALLNVLLFVPLGIGLAMAGARASRAIALMVFATVLIELLQLAFVPGRDASTGDVLANAVGGLIGFLTGARLDRLLRPPAGRAAVLMGAWLCGWLAWQSVAGFALHPRPTASTYYGQLARALGGRPAYPGHVVSATIDGAAIPDDRFADSRTAQDALASVSGAALSVTVASRYAPERLSVVRIADQQEREVLDLSADKSDVVAGVRTGASALRLRPVVIALRGAFADRAGAMTGAGRDTVEIRTRYGFQRVEMLASRGGHAPRAAAVWLTLAKSWRLVSPVVVYADDSGGQSALDALWLLFCLAPAGFWGAAAMRRANGARDAERPSAVSTVAIVGAIASALVVGLGLIPAIVQLAPTAPSEALGALAGLVGGATCGRAMDRRPRLPELSLDAR